MNPGRFFARSAPARLGTGRAGIRHSLLALLTLALANLAWADAPRVRVLALFPNKAMLEIDGRERLLRAGQVSPEGVTLVSADQHEAVVEVGGRRESLTFGTAVGGTFATPEMREVKIYRNAKGAYTTVGSINGRPVDLMVDTGATAIAMSAAEARRLGISYRLDGAPVGVTTASGTVPGHRVTLDRVTVGDITVRNVDALVIPGDLPEQVLLGLTFLNRVDMRQEGAEMVLRTKY
jgi:aspartyl protease family protein